MHYISSRDNDDALLCWWPCHSWSIWSLLSPGFAEEWSSIYYTCEGQRFPSAPRLWHGQGASQHKPMTVWSPSSLQTPPSSQCSNASSASQCLQPAPMCCCPAAEQTQLHSTGWWQTHYIGIKLAVLCEHTEHIQQLSHWQYVHEQSHDYRLPNRHSAWWVHTVHVFTFSSATGLDWPAPLWSSRMIL